MGVPAAGDKAIERGEGVRVGEARVEVLPRDEEGERFCFGSGG